MSRLLKASLNSFALDNRNLSSQNYCVVCQHVMRHAHLTVRVGGQREEMYVTSFKTVFCDWSVIRLSRRFTDWNVCPIMKRSEMFEGLWCSLGGHERITRVTTALE